MKLKNFRVRYARIVIMETVVRRKSLADVYDIDLPGVYDGISADLIGEHVEDIQDYEHVWEITEERA
jgi:hypothetical protein